jgi:hypothetical protein
MASTLPPKRVCYYAEPGAENTSAAAMTRAKAEPPRDAFRRGLEQFNRREFFEAHESWEEVWLAAAEPEKTFLQGLIQVSAAFHHYQRGNLRGAESLLRAGLAKLAGFPAEHRGLELEPLRRAAEEWLAGLAADRPPAPERLPQIRLARG